MSVLRKAKGEKGAGVLTLVLRMSLVMDVGEGWGGGRAGTAGELPGQQAVPATAALQRDVPGTDHKSDWRCVCVRTCALGHGSFALQIDLPG